MELFFCLSTFGELSLSRLTILMNKSKTTIHHHTRALEKNGIVLTREQETKNYREKYYRIHPELQNLMISDEELSLEDLDLKKALRNLSHLYRAFSAFVYSMMNRFSDYLTKYDISDFDQIPENSLSIHIVERKEYLKILKNLRGSISKIDGKSLDPSKARDSYAIVTLFMPYGELFSIDDD
jgi:DNA-binding transcriptional ArsR family regulator